MCPFYYLLERAQFHHDDCYYYWYFYDLSINFDLHICIFLKLGSSGLLIRTSLDILFEYWIEHFTLHYLMSCLDYLSRYSTGELQALQLIPCLAWCRGLTKCLLCVGLPFYKSRLKWFWVCKIDIMENNFFISGPIVWTCQQNYCSANDMELWEIFNWTSINQLQRQLIFGRDGKLHHMENMECNYVFLSRSWIKLYIKYLPCYQIRSLECRHIPFVISTPFTNMV